MTSARTATRNFDLLLAIATLRLPARLYVEVGTIPTIPVVYGGNRAVFFVILSGRKAVQVRLNAQLAGKVREPAGTNVTGVTW